MSCKDQEKICKAHSQGIQHNNLINKWLYLILGTAFLIAGLLVSITCKKSAEWQLLVTCCYGICSILYAVGIRRLIIFSQKKPNLFLLGIVLILLGVIFIALQFHDMTSIGPIVLGMVALFSGIGMVFCLLIRKLNPKITSALYIIIAIIFAIYVVLSGTLL